MRKYSTILVRCWLIGLAVFHGLQTSFTFAAESPESETETKTSAFDLKYNSDKPRKFLLPPLISLVLPGFDQYSEEQYGYAIGYTATAVIGLELTKFGTGSISTTDNKKRLGNLGGQLYLAAGEFSAYHSFRTAVRSRQQNGEFLFLKHEESPTDLLAAPFNFSYLTRPTTYVGIPAMLALGFALEKIRGSSDWLSSSWRSPNITDYAFAGAYSFNAGTGEEALFRGWIMPVSMHYTNSEFFSNLITSILFGAGHINRHNYFPISQTIGGFYLGYVAQKNDWSLGESIFIHTWYDVIAFLLHYATTNTAEGPRPPFVISPITIHL